MVRFEAFLPRFALGLTLVVSAATVAACSSNDDKGGGTTPDKGSIDGGTENTTPAIKASSLTDALQAAGLDPSKLPTWEELEASDDARKTKTTAIMLSFTKALGTDCGGCHQAKASAGSQPNYDFEAETEEKKVARRMYTDWVRAYNLADGKPLYCDSCHQGKAEFLDRKNEEGLSTWMATNFVAGLAPKDPGAAKVSCTTCHGTSFDPSFLDQWEKGSP
jgi:mono/diheme cytochrome c family protein